LGGGKKREEHGLYRLMKTEEKAEFEGWGGSRKRDGGLERDQSIPFAPLGGYKE